MSKTINIDRHSTYKAIMQRDKEAIADQLTSILDLLYNDIPGREDNYKNGWNDSRRVLRETLKCDDWIQWESK